MKAECYGFRAEGGGGGVRVDDAASLRESITARPNALWHLYELYHLGY